MENITICSFFVLSFGIILFIGSSYLYIKSKETMIWITTEGVILDSKIDKLNTGFDSPSSYKAQILYSYTVNNKEYKSSRIYYGDFGRQYFQNKSNRIVKKYKKEEIVLVYFNPLKPKESVLETGIHYEIILLFISSLLVIISAIFFMLYKI